MTKRAAMVLLAVMLIGNAATITLALQDDPVMHPMNKIAAAMEKMDVDHESV